MCNDPFLILSSLFISIPSYLVTSDFQRPQALQAARARLVLPFLTDCCTVRSVVFSRASPISPYSLAVTHLCLFTFCLTIYYNINAYLSRSVPDWPASLPVFARNRRRASLVTALLTKTHGVLLTFLPGLLLVYIIIGCDSSHPCHWPAGPAGLPFSLAAASVLIGS